MGMSSLWQEKADCGKPHVYGLLLQEVFVEEDSDFPQKLVKVAGMSCPNCGEREEGLWRLLGRADEFDGTIFVEEPDDE